MLRLPRGAKPAPAWPMPELKVPAAEIAAWRSRRGLTADGRPVVALAPGAGRTIEALAERSLRRPHPPAHSRRSRGLGAGRPGRKASGNGNRRRQRGARPHRPRPARRYPRARVGFGRGLQRFRPVACRGSPGHTFDRYFRPKRCPWHWAPLNPLAGHRRDQKRNSPAGRAINRCAGWSLTAACARSRPKRS